MIADLERQPGRFVVRILTASGIVAGVAMLVGRREVLTCAHVINHAMGRDLRSQDRPDGVVVLDFPLMETDAATRCEARVVHWLPPALDQAGGDDLAGLLIESNSVPEGAVPAEIDVAAAEPGRVVDVFGYPGVPPRPDGAWVEAAVRGEVGGGRIQLDSTRGAALRIQPGYSGSPVCDRTTGQVVGIVSVAPRGESGDRDSYAVSGERLVRWWPDLFGASGTLNTSTAVGQRRSAAELTVLHLSDPQFGAEHLFGGNGLTSADQAHDALFRYLHDDLVGLAGEHGLQPDLMIVTGDLADRGKRSEFGQAAKFLAALAEAVNLPPQHVAIIPGNHDVNRDACEAYFKDQAAEEQEPVPPYWRKWKFFAAAFSQFYGTLPGVTFTPDEPWTLFEMSDLRVVVAGLNSTMAESHVDGDHYGWVGEEQLRWFAERMAAYRRRGWLRLAAIHHNVVRGAVLDDENLRDSDELDRWLGEPVVNLLLHGHTHDGRVHRLSSGLIALSTGSAAVAAAARPLEVPNQYQLISIRPDGFTRYARQYSAGQRRWIGDTRISRAGSDWRDQHNCTFADVAESLADREVQRGKRWQSNRLAEATDVSGQRENEFMDRVREATEVKYPDALITSRPDAGYLRVSRPLADGGAEQWPVGVTDAELTAERIQAFTRVHHSFSAADPQVPSELVYAGPPAAADLLAIGQRLGIRLRSFVEYQGLLDLRSLVARQADRVAADRRYPAELYIPQRYRMLDEPSNQLSDGLLEEVIGWLGADGARFVMVLGDFGRGKTFLLRQLVRALPHRLPGLLPILVELRGLEKAPSLDELLAQHLVRQGVDTVELGKLRYMVRSGRLALLFDGFDELALRVSYDRAADYLQTLLGAVTERAKIVLTSRTQHFQSTGQVRTALGERVAGMTASRVAVVEDFTDTQIREFLVNYYGGDQDAAAARFELLGDIQDLLGLSRNPRMLSFIADLDEQRLRDVQQERGRISAAELYRELVDFWLVGEADRQRHRGGLPTLDQQERLDACTTLAVQLWTSLSPTIPLEDLSAHVSATLTHLAERGYSTEQAAQTVGSGTLLVRTDDGAFTFVHQSVMEWLVADAAARELREQQPATTLGARPMSRLMVDFLCDLAGHHLARDWAEQQLATADVTQAAKQNALDITARLGQSRPSSTAAPADLRDADLRNQDLTSRSFLGAQLRGADLRNMRLHRTDFSHADLSGADLRGARLVQVDLTGANISRSRWDRAALLGVFGLETLTAAPELDAAAIAGRDFAELMIQQGGSLTSVAISADGSLIALGRGPLAELRDLATGDTLRVLTGHGSTVNGVAFSSDGTLLATASRDGTARIWDTATGQARATLTGHQGTVNAVAFSSDGTLLATASRDGTARIWDTAARRTRATLTGHQGTVNAVAFSPDGTLVATGSDDGTARIWGSTSGQTRATTLTGHQGTVSAVIFSPDGTLVATGSDDRTARIWDTATLQARATLTGHQGTVNGASFSPDGTLLATASDDRTARIWDTATGQAHATLTGHRGAVNGASFSPDGTLLATASRDGTARIWDSANGQARATLTGRDNAVNGVAFSPDGTLLATVSDDRTVRIWDTATGQTRATLTGHRGAVNAVAFSPDGSLLATASYDHTARIWDTTTLQARAILTGHTNWVMDVAFSPDGALVATASYDHTARIWDTASGQARATLTGHENAVNGVAFSPDGALVATASRDRTLRIWDTAIGIWDATTGQARATLTGHTNWVTGVAFSPDGTALATASYDHTVRIWDTTTGQARATLTGHTNWVTGVAFSPDSTLLATASDDGRAWIWDTASGQARATLTGHTDWVTEVAFSPDSSLLATASRDGTVRIWDSATGRYLLTLLTLSDANSAVLLSDGSYKLDGDQRGALWWAIKLCRFEPGELDPYSDGIIRLSAAAKIRPIAEL